jgi:hypothetical protein
MTLREQPVLDHVMIDLETLATSWDAIVVSIGAAKWNANKIDEGGAFYFVLDLDDQHELGRRKDDRTVAWWSQQTAQARAVFDAERRPTPEVLNEFTLWLGPGNVKIWGNGADFDCSIWGSLYDSFGMKRPWSYSNNRCYRTLKNIARPGHNLPPRGGTHHNALDDALHQARCAQAYLKGTLKL